MFDPLQLSLLVLIDHHVLNYVHKEAKFCGFTTIQICPARTTASLLQDECHAVCNTRQAFLSLRHGRSFWQHAQLV